MQTRFTVDSLSYASLSYATLWFMRFFLSPAKTKSKYSYALSILCALPVMSYARNFGPLVNKTPKFNLWVMRGKNFRNFCTHVFRTFFVNFFLLVCFLPKWRLQIQATLSLLCDSLSYAKIFGPLNRITQRVDCIKFKTNSKIHVLVRIQPNIRF